MGKEQKQALLTREQVGQALHTLSDIELTYTEYTQSHQKKKRKTYISYFSSNTPQSSNLIRFYFPVPITKDARLPKMVTEWGVISEKMTIRPEYDLAVSKMFNFPDTTRHCCDYYTMIYLMEGSGTLVMDDAFYQMRAGDFYLIAPGVYYGAGTQPESICLYFDMRRSFIAAEYRQIFRDDAMLSEFFAQSLKDDPVVTHLAIHTENAPILHQRALDILTEYINQERYCNAAMKNHLALLMTGLLRSPKTRMESPIEPERMRRLYRQIEDYLRHNYAEASLPKAAEYMHFSRQYICKIVKRYSGDTFQNMLTAIRIEKVREYLEGTDLTQERISELCGFQTAAHMSRCFKQAYGMPPSVYRKERMETEQD